MDLVAMANARNHPMSAASTTSTTATAAINLTFLPA